MKRELIQTLQAALIFLVGLLIIILCAFGVFSEKLPPILEPTMSAVGASLVATAIYVLLSAYADKDDTIQQAISELKAIIADAGKTINSSEVCRVVSSNDDNLVKYWEKFPDAKTIDIACSNGGTIISRNKQAIKSALDRGARVRILINYTDYEFFNRDKKQYEFLQESWCPDKEQAISAESTIKDLKSIAMNVNGSGKVDVYYSLGLITGQLVIIDENEGYFTPYLPWLGIDQSFRVEFGRSAPHHISKLKHSFDTAWSRMESLPNYQDKHLKINLE